MAYKKFYVEGGYALVGYSGYQVPYDLIGVSSSRLFQYEDDYGNVIQYDEPMFRYDLECQLSNGYFHIIIIADEHHIISYQQGASAEGDGEYWDLSHLIINYGRDPYINSLYRQI